MALKSFRTARVQRDEPAHTAAPAAPPAPSAPTPRTVAPSTSIDATSEFEGTLCSKETVRIDGRVIGELRCEKTVLIGEAGTVLADVTAETVEVSGEVRGNITARTKLTLTRTARVTGDLTTPGIVIEEGATLQGRIRIGSEERAPASDAPRTAPRVEPAAHGTSKAADARSHPKAKHAEVQRPAAATA